jgi:hypothetical protein
MPFFLVIAVIIGAGSLITASVAAPQLTALNNCLQPRGALGAAPSSAGMGTTPPIAEEE